LIEKLAVTRGESREIKWDALPLEGNGVFCCIFSSSSSSSRDADA